LRNMKFQWKHWLLMFTALVMVVTLVAGCAAEEAEEKPTIKIIDGQWESMWIGNAIAEFIIEKGYGYPVEQVVTIQSVYMVAFPKGELDVHMEFWAQNFPDDWLVEHIGESGELENLGMTIEGGPQFFCIPQYVHEEHNINTLEDMKEHWELFEDPEDPTKGAFINSLIGWDCTEINKIKIEAYGLSEYYNTIESGSSGALEAAMTAAQKKHEPIFCYYWAPTSLMGAYDWYIFEEPEYDEDVWVDVLAAVADPSLRPLDEACAYESIPLDKIILKTLRDRAPDVVTMLEKFTMGLDKCNKAAAWASENELSGEWEKVAVWYLREYDSIWKTWVTTDAYNKIKAALDDYGPVP
jgi:glycine betaine/proline transport system substrate-binding protein